MNMAANMLGLGNAATPLGLRAMEHLERLNPPSRHRHQRDVHLPRHQHQLDPARPGDHGRDLARSAGSVRPSAIIGTAFMATICSTAVGITVGQAPGKTAGVSSHRARRSAAHPEKEAKRSKADEAEAFVEPPRALGFGGRVILGGFIIFFVALLGLLTFSPKLLDSTTPGPGEARITIKKQSGSWGGFSPTRVRPSLCSCRRRGADRSKGG